MGAGGAPHDGANDVVEDAGIRRHGGRRVGGPVSAPRNLWGRDFNLREWRFHGRGPSSSGVGAPIDWGPRGPRASDKLQPSGPAGKPASAVLRRSAGTGGPRLRPPRRTGDECQAPGRLRPPLHAPLRIPINIQLSCSNAGGSSRSGPADGRAIIRASSPQPPHPRTICGRQTAEATARPATRCTANRPDRPCDPCTRSQVLPMSRVAQVTPAPMPVDAVARKPNPWPLKS